MDQQLELWDHDGEPLSPAEQAVVSEANRQFQQAASELLSDEAKYWSVKRISLVIEGSLQERPCITSTQQAKDFFANYWKDNPGNDQERFVVACLDTKHRVQSVVVVTVGTLDASLVHPREVFKPAIIEGSSPQEPGECISRLLLGLRRFDGYMHVVQSTCWSNSMPLQPQCPIP